MRTHRTQKHLAPSDKGEIWHAANLEQTSDFHGSLKFFSSFLFSMRQNNCLTVALFKEKGVGKREEDSTDRPAFRSITRRPSSPSITDHNLCHYLQYGLRNAPIQHLVSVNIKISVAWDFSVFSSISILSFRPKSKPPERRPNKPRKTVWWQPRAGSSGHLLGVVWALLLQIVKFLNQKRKESHDEVGAPRSGTSGIHPMVPR